MLDVDQRPAAREAEEGPGRVEFAAHEATAPLDRTFDLGRISGEVLAWAGVLLAATGLRLAGLGDAALSPDGARGAFAAFSLFTGREAELGSAAGGPFAVLFGSILFFLFGTSDFVARLGPALAGIGLVAATIWLRPYLGRAGALLAGTLLAISPGAVYFSRRAQPDAYAAFFGLLLLVYLLRLFDHGRRGDLIGAAVAAALLFVSAPVGPTLLLLFALLVMVIRARGQVERAERARRARADEIEETAPPFGAEPLANAVRSGGAAAAVAAAAVIILVLSAFGARPGNLATGLGDLFQSWGRGLLGPAADGAGAGRGPGFALALLPLYEPLAIIAGLWGIARLFTNSGGVTGRGALTARAMLAVWAIVGIVLLALGGARQPGLLLLPALPLTLLAGAALGELVEAVDWRRGGWFWHGGGGALVLLALLALAAWGSALGLLLRSGAYIGQEQVWGLNLALTVLAFALPLSGAALWLGRRLGPTAPRALALAGVALLLGYGLRSAVGLGIYRMNSASEPLVYNATSPAISPLMDRIRRLSRDVTGTQRVPGDPTGGHGLTVAVDPAVEWPVRWYLRDFPNLRVGLDPAELSSPTPPQLLFRPADGPAPAGNLSGYLEQRYQLRSSYPAGAQLTSAETDNAFLRFFQFLLFRANVPPPPSVDIAVGYSPDLAARLFVAPPAQGPFALSERAGQGRAAGQFDAPRGVAFGRDGTVYVVDMRNARVQQFARDGAFVRQFGAAGRGDGQFSREAGRGATGLAIDADGFVYVADTWNHRIQKFSPEGGFVAKWGTFLNLVTGPAATDRSGFYGPRGIAIAPNGEVFVTDTGNARVLVFTRDGGFLREWGTKGAGPNQLDEPVGIAVSADGSRIYVADSANARISVFDPAGQPVAQWAVDAWRGRSYFEPYLALDTDGGIYATSSATRQVLKYSRDGALVGASTGTPPDETLAAPIGVAVAPDRGLYLTDTARQVIVRLEPIGGR